MAKINILDGTTRNPLQKIGECSGICWNSDTKDVAKNRKRAIECIESGHGRVLEFVTIQMEISEVSARVIREWYTHIGGMPTRLQESTRYVNESKFTYVVPKSISRNKDILKEYENIMSSIQQGYQHLNILGVPKEDCAMVLPLGMTTKIVDQRNLRNLIDMSRVRMCNRAYWEYRQLMDAVCKSLSEYSDEWKYIVDNYLHPKCIESGHCNEKKSCLKKQTKE